MATVFTATPRPLRLAGAGGFTSLGIRDVVSNLLSPWQDPYVKRLIGSIRRECLRCERRRRGCSGRPRHPRSFSLTSHALRAVGARRPVTAPAMERAVPERALHLPLVYDVPCACRRSRLAGARRSAPVAP